MFSCLSLVCICGVCVLHAACQKSDLTSSKSIRIRNILLCFLVSIYVCLECVCVYMFLSLVHTCPWRPDVDIRSLFQPLFILYITVRQGCSVEPGTCDLTSLSNQLALGFSVPASHLLWSSQEGHQTLWSPCRAVLNRKRGPTPGLLGFRTNLFELIASLFKLKN